MSPPHQYIYMCVCFSFVTPFSYLPRCLPPISPVCFYLFISVFSSVLSVGVCHLELSCMSDLLLFTPPQQQSPPTGKPAKCGRAGLSCDSETGAVAFGHVSIFLYIHAFYIDVFIWTVHVCVRIFRRDSLKLQCEGRLQFSKWQPKNALEANCFRTNWRLQHQP